MTSTLERLPKDFQPAPTDITTEPSLADVTTGPTRSTITTEPALADITREPPPATPHSGAGLHVFDRMA